jgi:CubicO group peptidase (beta-lactamase class C family)
MEKTIERKLQLVISEGVFPGAVIGVIDNGVNTTIPVGTIDGTTEVTKDTLYDVASITKAIPTSSLALYFLDKGELSLSDSLTTFVPQFQHPEVTIFHLLTQTLLLGHDKSPLILSSLKDKTPEEILSIIYSAELLSKPGVRYSYSNVTSILLGMVIEKISGESLEKAASRVFFTSLGMTNTSFHPSDKERIAPSEIDAWRGKVRGVVHDESAFALRKLGAVGSAGLFSTAPDLLVFVTMLLQRGVYKKKRYFTEGVIKQMYTNQLESRGSYSGLGWELYQPQYMGKFVHSGMFGKTGFTGCVVVIDPTREKAMVFLSNYTYPKRKENAKMINQVRREVADIVFES